MYLVLIFPWETSCGHSNLIRTVICNKQFLCSLFTDSLFSLQRSEIVERAYENKTARDLFIVSTRGWGGGGASFLARSRALSNGRTKEVYGQASCSCNLSYGFVAPLRDKNTRRNLVQHHTKEKFRLKINSRTSRFANVLFANELGQFASFFRLIKGLKNKVYTCVSDMLALGLKEGGIYLYSACIVS